VRLTTPEAFAGFVIKRLVELRERHPEVVVEVLSENRVLDVARGEADLALRFAPTTQNELVTRKLSDVNGAIYASASYVARRGGAVESIAGHEVVGYGEALATVPGARWLARHGDGATVVFRGNSLLSVLTAAAEGLGLAVLPCWLADPDPRLQRLSAPGLTAGSLYLVAHPDIAKIARVRTVMDFLIEIVERDRALLVG
jgi:DNA-binding transcriptional LysR family regulator